MNQTIQVREKTIGEGAPAYIIAEAGSNHDKKLPQAKELIDIAKECQADAVKFQLFKAESFYKQTDPMYFVMKDNEFPREWIFELNKYANRNDIEFLASPFDKEAVDLLKEINVAMIKIASSETVNLPLVRHAAKTGKPLIISTGMCSLADVYEAVTVAKSVGNNNVILLHTSSLYPTEPQDVNLRAMDTLRNALHVPVGLSDHTPDTLVPAIAVARGACTIEKHFTISRNLQGPDHSYALEPHQLKKMIQNIRETEQALGSPLVEMHNKVKKNARRNSIIARTDIKKDDFITHDMILTDRPATGIEPRYLSLVIGQRAKSGIKQGSPICWDNVD